MEAPTKEVTLKIDDKEVKAKEGTTILEAANSVGINIPTLCHHKLLSSYGSCRICSVEITTSSGRKRLVTSCNYPVEDGLVVYTKSEKVLKTRKTIMELLLSRTPKVSVIQKLARECGVDKPSFWVENENEECILCGLCVRVCDEVVGVHAIDFAKRGVEREVTTPYHALSEDCIGCGACALVCPSQAKVLRKTIYPVLEEEAQKLNTQILKGTLDENIGIYKEMFSAKSQFGGQDGGVATALLISGMQQGIFDAAIVIQRKSGYHAEAVVAETVEDILKAKSTKYMRVKMLPLLLDLIEKGKNKIAVVGTPCEVRAARKIQQTLLPKHPNLHLTIIGLFCFEAFDYDKLKAAAQQLLQVNLDSAEKTQIHKGQFTAIVNGKEHSIAVKELGSAIEKGCPFCDDFTNKYADVSVGSVGSPDGFSTVIVRSDIGDKLLEKTNLIKATVNKEEVVKLAVLKKKRATKNLAPLKQPEPPAQTLAPTPQAH